MCNFSAQPCVVNLQISTQSFFCQMLFGGLSTSIPLPLSQCIVPNGINGPVVIWITSDGQPLLNNVVNRATVQVVAGPTMAFIDTIPQELGQLARQPGSGTTSAAGSATTTVLTSAQAAALLSSASAAAASATPSVNDAQATPGQGGPSAITVDGWETVPADSV
jgi:hypothetical protein